MEGNGRCWQGEGSREGGGPKCSSEIDIFSGTLLLRFSTVAAVVVAACLVSLAAFQFQFCVGCDVCVSVSVCCMRYNFVFIRPLSAYCPAA